MANKNHSFKTLETDYKGQHHDQPPESYQCPHTGAHFKYVNLCALLESIRIKRGDPFCEQLPKLTRAESDNDSDTLVMEAKLKPTAKPEVVKVKKLHKLTTEYIPNQKQTISGEPEPSAETGEISRQISTKLNERPPYAADHPKRVNFEYKVVKKLSDDMTDVISGTTKHSLAFTKKLQSSSKEPSEHHHKEQSVFSMVSSPNICLKKNVSAADLKVRKIPSKQVSRNFVASMSHSATQKI